jgi:ribonuclease VapC
MPLSNPESPLEIPVSDGKAKLSDVVRRAEAGKEAVLTRNGKVAPVNAAVAADVALAYRRWGKCAHPAALNFGDCFACALASFRRARLLFVGENFARTDLENTP